MARSLALLLLHAHMATAQHDSMRSDTARACQSAAKAKQAEGCAAGQLGLPMAPPCGTAGDSSSCLYRRSSSSEIRATKREMRMSCSFGEGGDSMALKSFWAKSYTLCARFWLRCMVHGTQQANPSREHSTEFCCVPHTCKRQGPHKWLHLLVMCFVTFSRLETGYHYLLHVRAVQSNAMDMVPPPPSPRRSCIGFLPSEGLHTCCRH